MSTRRSSKRRRLAVTSQAETIQPPISVQAETMQPDAMYQSKTNETVQSISAAVTGQVLENLKAAGPTDESNKTTTPSAAGAPTSQNEGTHDQNNDSSSIHIPAQDIVSTFENKHMYNYKPLGRPLYSKINAKLQDKIRSREFIDMSDVLVDHQPAELDLHLSVKNKKIGLTSGKKRKFLTIETWTDAFLIFSSVIRKANPTNPSISEDLAIYMDLIRQIHKDGGDWFFYDVNFRQAMPCKTMTLCPGAM